MLKDLIKELDASNTKLIAVSKTRTVEEIKKMYDQGQRIFGENRVQELVSKYEQLPKDIEWHLIGHLQTNKVKYIAPFISLIHSIDSLKLLQEVNKQAKKNNRVIPCLLQFHIAKELSKFGMDLREATELLKSKEYAQMDNIIITGVMGMASFSIDEKLVRREFFNLNYIFEALQTAFFPLNPVFKEVSMGMSGDYKLAVEEGSTMVRIGSMIFGRKKEDI